MHLFHHRASQGLRRHKSRWSNKLSIQHFVDAASILLEGHPIPGDPPRRWSIFLRSLGVVRAPAQDAALVTTTLGGPKSEVGCVHQPPINSPRAAGCGGRDLGCVAALAIKVAILCAERSSMAVLGAYVATATPEQRRRSHRVGLRRSRSLRGIGSAAWSQPGHDPAQGVWILGGGPTADRPQIARRSTPDLTPDRPQIHAHHRLRRPGTLRPSRSGESLKSGDRRLMLESASAAASAPAVSPGC